MTVRYCDIHAFPDVQAAPRGNHAQRTSAAVFVSLLEAMVDFAADVHARLRTVRHDLASLSDYENHRAGKTQFLQVPCWASSTPSLGVIALNIILPILWIKWRKWW